MDQLDLDRGRHYACLVLQAVARADFHYAHRFRKHHDQRLSLVLRQLEAEQLGALVDLLADLVMDFRHR
ncbi:MAG: hypothetical protein Q8K85_02820, partial [Hyphomicrobium sp.]|nr:hypothetical protein [Hyphomicrobium sp.]